MTMTGWIILAVVAGFVIYLIKRMNSTESTSSTEIVTEVVSEKVEDAPATVDTPVTDSHVATVGTISTEVVADSKAVDLVKKPAAKKAAAKKPAAKKAAAKKATK